MNTQLIEQAIEKLTEAAATKNADGTYLDADCSYTMLITALRAARDAQPVTERAGFSKEWCMKMAELEAQSTSEVDVGAQPVELTDEEIKTAVLGDPIGGAALMSLMRDDVRLQEVVQAIQRIARAVIAADRAKQGEQR
jgi:hypothetical protein